ncbi:MAG: Crp/Fnr family transcriptional regulator [Spirochaetaceae bacterium]|nr:Crp/Fnr family transcriptional regulator [Spirochaetaceae bacterium]
MKDFLYNLLKSDIKTEGKISTFSDLFTLKILEKDNFIIRESDSNCPIGFLRKGVLRSFVSDYQGNEANVRFIRSGDIVSGGFSFNSPSPVNIQAITKAEVYFANWQHLQPFLKDNREFLPFLNKYLAIGSKSTTELLANFIRLNGEGRYKIFIKEYPELLESIPHYHIANFLGISPVQLSRIRKKQPI